MIKKQENYRHLIWTLAKTDFMLRYHGSVLGYIWALLKPLLMFAIMYFVFSNIFNPRSIGNNYYALELLLGIMLFTFFSEGTVAGMNALISKAQLVTKIYVPRWTIVVASTINSALIFNMNMIVLIFLFFYKHYIPSFQAIFLFIFFIVLTYCLILAFSLIAAPLYIQFRDLLMIWEVLISALFYASPIVYSLDMMPIGAQRVILINPMAFIIHFTKTAMIDNHFPDLWQLGIFIFFVLAFFVFSIWLFNIISSNVAEKI